MSKLPDFLKDYPVNAEHKLRKAPMAGWMLFHRWLVKSQHRLKMQDYARLMIIELEREIPRKDILVRLKSKFDIERRKVEMKALALNRFYN